MATFHTSRMLILVSVITLTYADCNRYTGPTGVLECVDTYPYYTGYQWATCLTNTYIQLVSNGRHICRDETARYCWYQCMIERYNLEGGKYTLFS